MQCGLNEGNTAQLSSMSVIAGWSIYKGLLTNILQTQKMEKKRTRKPNWTEEQGLLLAQLVNEHKGISPSVGHFVQLLRGTLKPLKVLFPALSRSRLRSPFKR